MCARVFLELTGTKLRNVSFLLVRIVAKFSRLRYMIDDQPNLLKYQTKSSLFLFFIFLPFHLHFVPLVSLLVVCKKNSNLLGETPAAVQHNHCSRVKMFGMKIFIFNMGVLLIFYPILYISDS